MVSTFLALKGVLSNFLLFYFYLLLPMTWVPPFFPSLSVHLLLFHLSLLPALIPGLLTDLLPELLLDLISIVCCFVLVDALFSIYILFILDNGGPMACGVFSHASLKADLIFFTIKEPDFINVLGTPGRVLVIGFLCPWEGSNCSTVFPMFCFLTLMNLLLLTMLSLLFWFKPGSQEWESCMIPLHQRRFFLACNRSSYLF